MTGDRLLHREVGVNVAGGVGLLLPLLALYADSALLSGAVAYLGFVWVPLLGVALLWALTAALT